MCSPLLRLLLLLCLIQARVMVWAQNGSRLFDIMTPQNSGIDFNGHSISEYIQGGGVSVMDINNDGLPDLYFTADSVNAVYINQGNMQFLKADSFPGSHSLLNMLSVNFIDINNDGLKDIVISGTDPEGLNKNLLALQSKQPDLDFRKIMKGVPDIEIYINKGSGIYEPYHFTDNVAAKMKGRFLSCLPIDIHRSGHSDLFFNQYRWTTSPLAIKNLFILDTATKENDHLLLLNDKGILKMADNEKIGLTSRPFDHISNSAFVSDLDKDGWPDLYVSNDWDSPDFLYRNDHGKFKDITNRLGHISQYSMGIDIADINNDGLPDIFIDDMRPTTNFRQKTNFFENPLDWTELLNNLNSNGPEQISKNTLQLNLGHNQYSEIGELAGLDKTEWSWSTLIADFDNDGYKDIFVSNGNIHFAMLEGDYALVVDSFRRMSPERPNPSQWELGELQKRKQTDTLSNRFINYIYKNNGDLTFQQKNDEWGMGPPVNSNGAAYADLDNDGDLDIVVNNNQGTSFIYKNNARQLNGNNYIRFKLLDKDDKPTFNSKVAIHTAKGIQYFEMTPTRGYLSLSEDVAHFGLGKLQRVDSVDVQWPDGSNERFFSFTANRVDTLYKNTGKKFVTAPENTSNTRFIAVDTIAGIHFTHKESDFNDFYQNPLLPEMMSKLGPACDAADLNGDGLDDIVFGGSPIQASIIYWQKKDGSFSSTELKSSKAGYADVFCKLIDLNKDGLKDIIMVSASNEFFDKDSLNCIRIYMNAGSGKFKTPIILPTRNSIIAKVVCADIDGDGLPEILACAKFSAGNFPEIPTSYLFRNTKNGFTDITQSAIPELGKAGMISDAVFTDFNEDGIKDLIVTSYYGKVEFFKGTSGGRFNYCSNSIAISDSMSGMWNCILATDMNGDGKPDYILGNTGRNIRFKTNAQSPYCMYYSDFDDNGYKEIITAYCENGKLYPTKQLKLLAQRINGLWKKFPQLADFASCDVTQIFGKDKIAQATTFTVNQVNSLALINEGNGKFRTSYLPIEAQFAPLNDITELPTSNNCKEYLMAGNNAHFQIEQGKIDAMKRVHLTAGCSHEPAVDEAITLSGDMRKPVIMKIKGELIVVYPINNGKPLFFKVKN